MGLQSRRIGGKAAGHSRSRSRIGRSRLAMILSSQLRRIAVLAATLGLCLTSPSCNLLGTAASAGLLKLQFGCLAEGSLIDTPAGPVAVEDLSTGDLVTGYRGEVVVVRQVHQYHEEPSRPGHLRLGFENGATLVLSRRHRVDGVPAEDLAAGDEVAGNRLLSVEAVRGISRSFDLLTDDAGYRIGGIPVNSMIEEMAAAR